MFLVNSCLGSLAAAPSLYLQDTVNKDSSLSICCLKDFDISLFSKENWQCHLVNKVTGQTLSRSYGRYIAEFLNEESLVHLGLLDLSTCVGLRYGQLCTYVQ